MVAVGLVAAVAAVLAVTGATPAGKRAGILACGLMPDTKTSVRWEQFDQPYLEKAFKAAGVSARVVNAQGDPQKQKSQADQCIADGAKVLIIAPIDSGSAAAIEKAALAKGVKSIDYDRQVEGGVAVLYASFDGHQVGVLQGQGVVDGLKKAGKYGSHPVVASLWGGQEDANSYLFKGGVDKVLNPLYASGTLKQGPAAVRARAGTTRRPARSSSRCSSRRATRSTRVAAANDGLANAVVVALKAHKLKPIPLSGQDATTQGVQNIISGWQTMTVWKDVRLLATKTARRRRSGSPRARSPRRPGLVKTKGRAHGAGLPDPAAVDHEGELAAAHLGSGPYLKKADVCSGEYKKYC